MKIALVHDHLVQDGGAEYVLKVLTELYPKAPIFTLAYDKRAVSDFFQNKKIITSFLQRLPFGVSRYQWWLSVMPAAIEHLDLSDYDLVISSASSFAKGVITKPGTLHICYCHTPTRYLWTDSHSYIQELSAPGLIKRFLPLTLKKLRLWDRLAVERVDSFIANSETVRRRIKKYYQRESTVMYPPVAVDDFYLSDRPKKYYLAGGRLVPYKRVDIAVKAFSRLGIPLKVFGVGPEMKRLRQMAKSNVQFLGKISDGYKKHLFAESIAYINPQEEDFGITAVEAMAAGRPVIAYRAGGAVETMIAGKTGEFFDEQTWEELADTILRFKHQKYRPESIRAHAEQYSTEIFKHTMSGLIAEYAETLKSIK